MSQLRKIQKQAPNVFKNLDERSGVVLQPAVDVTEFKIEQLNPETGEVDDTLILRGTHLPFQPLEFITTQEVMKYYYPGGPPERRPTVQIIGSMDEDVVLSGRLKATKLKNISQKDEPLIIAQIMERFVREGKPCKIQVGFYIKFVVLKDIKITYRTNNDIMYALTLAILGNENPITGDSIKEQEEISDKVFESESEQDISVQVQELQDEFVALKEEMKTFGYDYPIKRGGILGFIDTLFDTVDQVERIINEADEAINSIIDEIERNVQRLTKALGTVRRLRSRLYRVQTRLYGSYLTVKNATFPNGSSTVRQSQSALTIGNSLQQFIANLHLSLKKEEDALTVEAVSFIKRTYVVKEGDTWQTIAVTFYNSPDRWQEIEQLNEGPLTTNRIIIIPN